MLPIDTVKSKYQVAPAGQVLGRVLGVRVCMCACACVRVRVRVRVLLDSTHTHTHTHTVLGSAAGGKGNHAAGRRQGLLQGLDARARPVLILPALLVQKYKY